ncbi:hypothetical protein KSP40_PGU007909 [Platanthera guangdongensis]|uniref:Transmembrane protein n=1 Tax=Platanthera guangdongensis TaxID=2320717 RepID=A0ABR2M5Y7_9ASPA
MHRSASSTRVSDEYYMTAGQAVATRSAMDIEHLPMYDPQLEIAKKETARLRLAENTVHLIPVIIIICAMLLWFFSNPEIEMAIDDDSVLARIKNMSIDGYSNWNSTSMTIGLEDLDPIDGFVKEETAKDADSKNKV